MVEIATKTKETVPTAITGAFLAGLTVLMTASIVLPKPWAILFPPWAVFITWAGYFAAGGGGKGQGMPTFKKMYVAILWGDIWGLFGGLGIVFLVGSMSLSLPVSLLLDGIVIFLVNQPILWGTRYWGPIKYTPAIFYGFATFFSTYFGGFGFYPGPVNHYATIVSAFITAYLANAVGPLFGYLQVRLARIREVPVEEPAGA